jgi:predicted kinase
LIAIGGLSGTGKSTLAAHLAPEFGRCPGARLLRSDVLRKIICGSEQESALASEAYAPSVSDRVYEALCAKASMALAAGSSAVIDAVALREEQRLRFEVVAETAGVPFIGLWLEACPEHMIRRVAERSGDASDASPAIVREQLKQDPGALTWARIDASGDPNATFLGARRAITELIGA